MSSRQTIYTEIDGERDYQDKKWGGSTFDDTQTKQQWEEYIMQYAVGERGPASFRARMIKVAALAVAAIESHERLASSHAKSSAISS